jgi:hypothetical protein
MTEAQVQAEIYDPLLDQEKAVGEQKHPVVNPHKKKASWLRTILWMLSMVLLVNVIMAVIAYILHCYRII